MATAVMSVAAIYLQSFLPLLLSPPFLSLLNPARRLQLGKRCELPQRVLAEPDCQTLYGTFYAENHDFGDTKSALNYLFVSRLEF